MTLTARGKEGRVRSPNNTLVDSVSNSTTGRSVMAATTSTHATIAKVTTRSLSVKKEKTNRTHGPTPVRVRNTPVKPDVLSHYLQGYDQEKASYLVDGFSYGFHVESEGLVGSRTEVHNPRMAEHLRPVLRKKLQKEIDAGRILGPFHDLPFPDLRLSPIRVAPKKNPGEYRFIHNLSLPYDEEAVNTSIPREKVSVQYSTADDAVSHIKEVGSGAHMAKTDIKSAFRIVPIHPEDFHLLGMKLDGLYFYDTTLPMSCAIFEAFSSVVQWIATNKLGIPRMVHVLDDFLIIGPSSHEASIRLERFLAFCEECGIPMSPEKTEGPSQVMIFLGITLDVPNSMMVLPEEKLKKCRSLIEDALAWKSITLRELQSLLGHLNFACKVTVPGRAFLRRAYALTHGAKKPFHHIKITSGTRSDLVMWQDFLSEYNGKSFFLLDKVYTDQALQLYTDSAKSIGYGAVLGCSWLYGEWPEEWKGYDITFLELYPIVLSSIIWGHRFQNQTIEFHTDNLGLISVINKCSSPKPHIMCLVRGLVLAMLRFNFVFYAIHVPGVQNVLADALSREQIGRFRSLHPRAERDPVFIPDQLKPGASWLQ